MNIWYLHPYATPYELPGLHRPFQLGHYFIKENENKLTVFTASYLHFAGKNVISNHKLYEKKDYQGITTVFVKCCSYKNSLVKRVFNLFQYWIHLNRLYKKYAKLNYKPDIIIASSPHPLALLSGLKIAKKFGIPCISEVRDLWPEDFFIEGMVKEKSLFGKFLLRVERYIYEKSNRIVFLKEGDFNYIIDHQWDTESKGKIDIKKCKYVNNGVDIKLFDERKNKYIKSIDKTKCTDSFNIVYTGTIRPGNHIDLLLDVAKLVKKNVFFHVFGTGTCFDEISQRIKDENIDNVVLYGYIDNKYIPSILSSSSAAILNYSDKDYNWSRGNSSNKLFEYLASGKPVISTVQMGYDILSRYKCGFSSDKCTPVSIAETIDSVASLSNEQYLECCLNARKAAYDFDIPNLANKYLDILKETIKK